MITELADFSVQPDHHEAFGQALAQGVATVLSKAEGYLGHEILASQETRGRWVLLVRWSTLEAHTVGFRESSAFAEWRALIGPYFAQPPRVEHFDLTDASR
ncbi:MAG: antibiotic biosynthesis monooxygenase [Burkholderiaceae bacterium]|nr:antibiotic biosynthesis monooxygenase [Burkholderiaceae bacterium]